MLVDSHCHLNYPQLNANLSDYLSQMQQNGVNYALCVGTRLDNLAEVTAIASAHANIFAAVGVHPDEELDEGISLTKEHLLSYTANPKVIAIGETGLDYLRIEKEEDRLLQQQRFILHVEASIDAKLPVIIHTRDAIADTLDIMQKHNARACGGVMHCFTENEENAKRCLDLGFYISISGIVTFSNARLVQDLARYVPLDKLLIETDAPFLAPVPFRGKTNHPALLKYTAQYIADLKGISLELLAEKTSANFFALFTKAVLC